jgi:RND family efflux transporter MFP subunit
MSTRALRVGLAPLIVTLAVAAVIGGWEMYRRVKVIPSVAGAAVTEVVPQPAGVSAIGRLEPKDGLRRIAGPSRPSVVIGKLLVEEGDAVTEGQPIAVLDDLSVLASHVARLRARLENDQAEYERNEQLFREHTVSASQRDTWRMRVDVARADLQSAQAELDLATVRAPIGGKVVKIYARTGERVGPDGIAEIGATDMMYVVAEVYETDVGRVHVGERATVTSPALSAPVYGTVERIGLKVAKQDVLHTDPAAETDARIVEVKVRLDDSTKVAGLTNLETEVVITP